MSSALMSLLVSHILTFVENELLKEEPTLVSALVQDIKSLITKLESLIEQKSPTVASVVNPVLDGVEHVAVAAIEAAGNAAAGSQ